VLRTLAAAGLLTSRIVPSYSGPPRRYYRITAPGREALAQWRAVWGETYALVQHFLS
jgi:PadR family transcriptional regulator, regulatory protein PadR